ncbi:MAG: hypothetical protein MJ051_03360 [Akkermansia sp.]|nr:hypothetical protein [Akkermansia sp.]
MSIYQDNFTGLSELERLAAMAHDPVRVHEIGEDQWPLAMMACGLMASNDEEKQAENLPIYSIFVEKTSAAARKAGLLQFTRFIAARKGEGWKSLVPYAVKEPEPAISLKAALQLATLAQPGAEQVLAGVEELVKLTKEYGNPMLLNAALSLADMRVLPLLAPLTELKEEALELLLGDVLGTANRLSLTWLLNVLTQHPSLAEAVTEALCRTAKGAQVILDVAMPIPTWRFEKPVPQPLHGWQPAEYFARMLPELEPVLSAEQLARVRAAFGA